MKSRIIRIILAAVMCVLIISGANAFASDSDIPEFANNADADSAGESSGEIEGDGIPEVVTAYIIIRGFEWGPGVNKVVLEIDEAVDGVCVDDNLYVKTSHWDREVRDVYLSNRMGYPTIDSSQYVTFELETSYECGGSPFEYDVLNTQHNYWAEEYLVIAAVTVKEDGKQFELNFEGDCINNHFSPDVVAFTELGTYSGEYFNVLHNETETLSLNYAFYEPDSLAGGEPNPLIIWLHGRGEGGDDIEVTLLANEVSALTETQIQYHFISGDQTGAYVLVPQTPTYWRDAGDGVEHMGDMPSRYREILMDLIQSFLDRNPDIDKNRIYISGASNGGYMTLEMIENYPDTFAAAIPVSPGMAYNVYARNDDGSYRTIQGENVKTGDLYLTEEKVELLKQTPIWIIGAATDTITPVLEYSAPMYYAMIIAGAENCWCSMYQNVIGTESTNTRYLGHWVWIYLLNDEVRYVQDPEVVANSDEDTFYYGLLPDKNGGTMEVPDGNGGTYKNIYDWLNDQSLQ